MVDLDAQFREAVSAYKAGDKDQARELLLDVVDKDERHEQAWLYLSALVGTLDEQQICLENVLAINPDNQRAKKGLEKVNQQIAVRDQDTGAGNPPRAESRQQLSEPHHPDETDTSPFASLDWDSMPSPSSDKGGGGSVPIGAEFGGASGDSLMDQDSSIGFPSFDSLGISDEQTDIPDSSMNWLNQAQTPEVPQEPEPYDSGSSVDWGHEDQSAAYGSGKNVNLPSEQQYDDWVQGLNIDSDISDIDQPDTPNIVETADQTREPTESPAFSMGGEGPFGETGYMLDADVLAAEPPDAPVTGTVGSDSEDQSHVADQDSRYAASEASYDNKQSTFGAAVLYDHDSTSDDQDLDDLDFSFDDDDDDDLEPFGSADAGLTSASTAAASHSRYFALIPDDIPAKGGGTRRGLMFLGILLLLALNAASFAMLLM